MKDTPARPMTVGELRDALAGLSPTALAGVPDTDEAVGELTTSYGTFEGHRVFCLALDLPQEPRSRKRRRSKP